MGSGGKSTGPIPGTLNQKGEVTSMAITKATTKAIERKYGWIPDTPDFRDFGFTAKLSPQIEIALPDEIDLRGNCSKIEDQGNLGSCTGNMLAGLREYKDRVQHISPLIDYSRLFAYFYARKQEGSTAYDAGASIRDVIKTMSLYGTCDESLWPYKINKFATQPSQKAILDAANRKITTYHRLDDVPDRSAVLHNIQLSLAGREPVGLGISVYESFESSAVAKNGIVPMPKETERLLGGHAIGLFGYSNKSRMLYGRNSWGSSWGDHGYFYLPYDYILNSNLSADMWVIDFDIPKFSGIMDSYKSTKGKKKKG